MNHSQPRQYFAANQRAVSDAGAIEWEELPSLLAHSLAQRLVTRSRGDRSDRSDRRDRGTVARGANDSQFQGTVGGTPWDATMPAEFDPAPISQPFSETIAGISTREVVEPDVFHHFFGADKA